MGNGPLSGLRIIDLTSVIMGPMATVILGDLGAEVIKVESPTGDVNRTMGRSVGVGQSELSLNINRNKSSVVLDLKSDEGHRRLMDLIVDADVFVTNMRPRALRRLGISYDDLRAVNDRLIYCAMHGFNSDSALADAPAYDDVVQGESGLAGLPTHVDGKPQFAPYLAGDKISALYVAIAILAANSERLNSGSGSFVEVPMVDVLMSFNLVENLAGQTVLDQPADFGWSRTLTLTRAMYSAADGWVIILPYSDTNWEHFFELIDRTDLVDDERFANLTSRTANMEDLIREVAPHIGGHTVDFWIDHCSALDIPVTRVKDPEQVIEDPYAWEAGVVSLANHPEIGAYRRLSTPIRFNGVIPDNPGHAPSLGAETIPHSTSSVATPSAPITDYYRGVTE